MPPPWDRTDHWLMDGNKARRRKAGVTDGRHVTPAKYDRHNTKDHSYCTKRFECPPGAYSSDSAREVRRVK